MPNFYIHAREIHFQAYRVEAESAHEAVKKFDDGEGEIYGDLEYSHIDEIAYVTNEDHEMLLDEEWEDNSEVKAHCIRQAVAANLEKR